MKIKYEFDKETVEIEVDEQWGQVVLEFDRQEYNNNQTETRRHNSLYDFSPESKKFTDSVDVLGEVLRNLDYKELYTALDKLKPRHRNLIIQQYFNGVSQNELARLEGVTKGAISQSISCAIKNLKKFMKKT